MQNGQLIAHQLHKVLILLELGLADDFNCARYLRLFVCGQVNATKLPAAQLFPQLVLAFDVFDVFVGLVLLEAEVFSLVYFLAGDYATNGF